MISGILIFNTNTAELVISRFYKNDYNPEAIETFRINVISSNNYNSPCLVINRNSFLFIRHNNLLIVAVTKQNVNAHLVYQFLYKLIDVFSSYFNNEFNAEKIRSNFVLIYELFDEVMDHGYPQIVDSHLLQKFIHTYTHNNSNIPLAQKKEILSQITMSKTPWRPQQEKYQYKHNKVYLNVTEHVNVLINSTQSSNKLLSSYCTGVISMQSELSGMPICRFGLNDVISMKKRNSKHSKHGIDLQDVRFHECVRLNKYSLDKTIMFIPPDGKYDLMCYRSGIINERNIPFNVTSMITEKGRNRIEYHIKIKALYQTYNIGENICVSIPVPKHTSNVDVKVNNGKCVYEPTKYCLQWNVGKLAGGQCISLKGEVNLLLLINDKEWIRPPITMHFSIPMWCASGVKVRFLNVQEPRINYKSVKWVKYVTKAGNYQIRI